MIEMRWLDRYVTLPGRGSSPQLLERVLQYRQQSDAGWTEWTNVPIVKTINGTQLQ